ncbi:MAG: hypothetical protein ABS87_04145 [Sphingomonas sp. SCN 67-18]|uniref:glycosyltransferase n=1 Tax=uncultured Sphingomonas sp. TaxID=158754 RepID=UPI00086DD4E6|nr:glycosyl transferase-like UDP-glucuronosyltransferase [Sphingomonas sp. SCN 67-18]ODU21910.1 MAG: hypothetical protein ABS87_04145 [Sphingomonas sp. SCN 67-18]
MVDMAVQRIDAAEGLVPAAVPLWQAPLWPRLLVNAARPGGAPVATMGDILVRLGLDRPETLAALIGGWDSILSAVRPDVVVADFAPALLMAARGRMPALGVGTGFERPPAGMAHFPSLTGGPPAHDEGQALDNANAGLARAGRDPIAALPAINGADVSLAGVFAELDAYAAWRTEPPVAPAIAGPLPPLSDGGGDEVFVYGFTAMQPDSEFWHGLAASGLPVRIHVGDASPALVESICALGMAFEPQPLPFARIAARSRLVVSHGGHGFVCSALAAGLPQVVVHYDMEKRGYGVGLARAGLGGEVALQDIRREPFAQSLRALHADAPFAAGVRAAAPAFRARMTPAFADVAVAEIRRLAGLAGPA